MRHRVEWLEVPGVGAAPVHVHGHHGRPLLALPSEGGDVEQWARDGMVGAVADLVEAGRVKVFTVPSHDMSSWSNDALDIEGRARAHQLWEDWLLHQVCPFIAAEQHGPPVGEGTEVLVAGVSMGAYHAANLVLRHAHRFPLGICMSGVYDVTRLRSWGTPGEATYFHNPMAYVANLHGDHLDWLRQQATLVLAVGEGQWEDTTGANEGTHAFAARLAEKGLRHELAVWGREWPHDWPSWRAQLATYLPRYV